ncbi:MAG: hypothetical protein COY38_04660 [Candidatus Aenigmarchaeota archaeon CG_4_10_14_0_8_um_filter_37_24]|nr:DUF5320 domain-containing protein [Candidatus Aenigmarchaeota archaeon]OIN88016.1 MAG: hypothetical protein AUJ50_02015 [Candidatus Aenigmarchaeota archaeon CG1_02_38_14]OIP34490.1 MAG: hypothetical protein AUK23_01635 [Deltaproteobacteria bacterium CG2_30_43_15]PIV68996.1 MAG: hypothetical protein COS07_02265 [Candidatus Aenigmarchaeota archaeon CG01_land_8_20_14_3_00_37_9]PIW41626.1 MAG: hypothetical protein COW21_00870 [Candidatus Aenigmarchaeota archaeon CG15_BIG_FIL_POST_REV_8_21_14_020
MPGQDRTGPLGEGAVTGRGLGPCGRGMGFRRGFGRRYCQILPAEQLKLTEVEQKKILEAELKEIEAEKQIIEKRLEEMK